MTIRIASSPVLWVGVVVGTLVFGAAWIGGAGPGPAILGGAMPIAYGAIVTVVGRRYAAVSTLAGRPGDERGEHINLEAATWSLGATAIVVLGAFMWADATGGAWQPFAFIAAVMAAAYVVALVVIQARH